MATLTEDQGRAFVHKLLTEMAQAGGSDLFLANDFPPSMRLHGTMTPMSPRKLTGEVTRVLANSVMNATQREEFDREMECNFAIAVPGIARFRVNVFVQQACVSMICRIIASEIPDFEKLDLPEVLKQVIMSERGLVLMVGGRGSGKSTSLAALIEYRNRTSAGHIITIEDPVEYVHVSRNSLITHREVGIDTHSWHAALKNALRQAPDVVLIGEIRDAETIEHAIAFAESGHLCVGTVFANNTYQAINRVINFFPEDRRSQLLKDLCLNLHSVVSQRLVKTEDGKGRKAAVEVLINTPVIADLIVKGAFNEIKNVMENSRETGMRTFDWALFDLYNSGHIAFEEAIRNADSAVELRLNIKLKSKRGEPAGVASPELTFDEGLSEEQIEAQRQEELAKQEATKKEFEAQQLAKLMEEKKNRLEMKRPPT